MLSRLHLKNFKAARDLEVNLASLTVLAGLNGSGKSTVLQALAALRQSYASGDGTTLFLGGDLVQMGSGKDVLSEGAETELITFEMTVDGRDLIWQSQVDQELNRLPFITKPAPAEIPTFLKGNLFHYLQADRIVPRTLYPQDDGDMVDLGVHGQFTVGMLSRPNLKEVSKKRLCQRNEAIISQELWDQIASTEKLVDQIAGWFQYISPGVHLQADKIKGTDDVMLQFRYLGKTQGRSNYYRPTHVGFGLTYSLPIVVACLTAEPGSLLLIENPEAHLHPEGQLKIGELVSKCASDGVQVIVETHSDHVLNGIRLSVKRKLIAHSDVQLCNFHRQLESGDCYYDSPAVMEDGQLTAWPTGFFDQWEKSVEKILG